MQASSRGLSRHEDEVLNRLFECILIICVRRLKTVIHDVKAVDMDMWYAMQLKLESVDETKLGDCEDGTSEWEGAGGTGIVVLLRIPVDCCQQLGKMNDKYRQ